MVVCDAHRPAACRRPAGDCDVAADRDQHAGAGLVCGCRGRTVGRERLRSRAEIELDAGRYPQRAALVVELDVVPATGRLEGRPYESPVAKLDVEERPVVPDGTQRAADGRIDEALGLLGC